MSDNKFIERLKGKDTSKSILEINNEAAKTSFANMPSGTSNAIDVYSDHRADATAVLNGTINWKISNSNLILANNVSGDGTDFSSTYSVSGTGLWINSVYTFPSTGDPAHPVAMVFNPSTKWVLKVCGDNLIVDGGYIADFTLLVKIGTSNIFTKNFSVAEQAGSFCKEFVLDFNETNTGIVKASGLSTLTVQLLCGTANASARIYNGMTVLTCLQRKVDASAVSNSFANVEEVMRDGLLPNDYFSNAAFIDQVEDGDKAYAVFQRDGDEINLAGWDEPIPSQTGNSGKYLTTDGSDMSWHQITASDVGALPDSTKYGASFSLSMNSSNFVITAQLKDQDGNNLGSAQTIDLPLESVVVNGSYDNVTKSLILTLENGNTITIPIADLISGLQEEITVDNKLDADLVDDSTSTNKFVTASDITNWNGHIVNTNNPHQVTKAQVGLGNVDNTSDLAKPISTATQTALDTKANKTNLINGAPLSNSSNNFFGVSSTAAATVQKEVSIPSITSLEAGIVIIVQPTVTSTVASSTLKLNSFDAYPMRYNNAAITTSTDSIVWNQNCPSIFVFDGTYWVFAGHGLDSNTTYTLNYSVDAGQYTAGSGTYAITRYSILAQKADGTWEKITATNANYSTGTSKSVNTSGFILNQLRYYGTTTNVASGVKVATNVVYEKAASVDMRYSTNCGGTTTWAVGDYIYLVGTIGADGLFYLDTTTWWSNALPTTNDGKLYIRLGLSLTAAGYTMSFFEDRPIFYHDGTGIKEYKVADNKQDVISDLATIRSGASAGATAVQPSDLATVATSGSYNDLLNKPTIPAAQVNSDWNAVSGVAQILNKPTLATVATSGSYNDLSDKPTIPTVNNATLTITQGGVSKGTFTANAGTDVTIALDAGGGGGAVDSVNGQTGVVVLTASDVGAQPTITGAATTITTNNLSAARAVITNANGKISVSSTTSTELGYLSGVTSSVQTQLNNKVNSSALATVATSGSYNDLSNKPTIPTVGNGTITITQGGISKGTFTTNQSGNTTIALDAGGGGSVDIDNSTITKNGSNQLQAVATINANTAVGAANPVYDWVGTLAEYTSQAVATNHPDWVCYITDDVSGGATVYTKTQVDTGFVAKGHELIAFQEPNAGNGYTWYRKYADGFVIQGGGNVSSSAKSVTFPIVMADTNYTLVGGELSSSNDNTWHSHASVGYSRTTTGFSTRSVATKCWVVYGMAA